MNDIQHDIMLHKLNIEQVNHLQDSNKNKTVKYSEQEIEFIIGRNGYKYYITIIRDENTNISDIIRIETLCYNPSMMDDEDITASTIINDAYVWYDLDNLLFYATKDITFIYPLNVDKFISNHDFKESEMDFLINQEDINGEIEIYFTVTENTLYYKY